MSRKTMGIFLIVFLFFGCGPIVIIPPEINLIPFDISKGNLKIIFKHISSNEWLILSKTPKLYKILMDHITHI